MTGTESEAELEQRSANLRKVATVGLAGDLMVAALLVLMKDSLGLGDVTYLIAALLAASGICLFVFLPRIPRMAANRNREVVQKESGLEKK